MKLKLQRYLFTDDYTMGLLFIDGVYFCDTIEDTYRGQEGITMIILWNKQKGTGGSGGGGSASATINYFDGITGTTLDTQLTLGNAVMVFKNGVLLEPTNDYSISGVEEGTQEAIQSVGTDLIYKFNDISDLKAIDIIKNASNDFLFAFLSGGMVGAVTSNIQYNDILNKTKKELTALKDDKGQKVYTPEQADRVAKQTAQLAMSQNIIDEVTGVSRAERDNSLSKEARNPKTIKQELEDNHIF